MVSAHLCTNIDRMKGFPCVFVCICSRFCTCCPMSVSTGPAPLDSHLQLTVMMMILQHLFLYYNPPPHTHMEPHISQNKQTHKSPDHGIQVSLILIHVTSRNGSGSALKCLLLMPRLPLPTLSATPTSCLTSHEDHKHLTKRITSCLL